MKANKASAHKWIIITDLDGTLLNHHTYDASDAMPTITSLLDENIPVIFNTSKTFEESLQLQSMFNITSPFIIENGSAIYLPKNQFKDAPSNARSHADYWEIVLGKSQLQIENSLLKIDGLTSQYQLLSQCSVDKVIELTGLSESQAIDAKNRCFSEPIIWLGTPQELDEFRTILHSHGLNTLQGGRFLHILGNTDKGQASCQLINIYRSIYPNQSIKTIILGDSPNDIEMLNKANISVMVKSPNNRQLQEQMTCTISTRTEAPAGWSEGVTRALDISSLH